MGDVKGFWITGDSLEEVKKLPDGCVDLIVTSPPFLALRSYMPDNMPGKEHEIGLEADPSSFLDVLIELTNEWERVLAPHGSICVELGDTYSSGEFGWPEAKSAALIPELYRVALAYGFNPLDPAGTPELDARWLVRNTVRWVRKNPAPGAVGDKFRPATSEMVVACKSPKRYFDMFPVRRPLGKKYGADVDQRGGPPLDWWEMSNRNTQPGHFATYPPELVVRPVLSMCPIAVCLACGKPARRVTETVNAVGKRLLRRSHREGADPRDTVKESHGSINESPSSAIVQHVGWEVCECEAPFRPGVVLDPFAGSGTTLAVATGHGRIGIGIDLDPRNVELGRASVGPLMFEDITGQGAVVSSIWSCAGDPPSGAGPVEGGEDASEESSSQEASDPQGSLYEEGDE